MDSAIIALLREGRSVVIAAEGRSMHPFLRRGDFLTIRPLGKQERIRAGDLILSEDPAGRWLAHRALRPLREKDRTLTVKGDALIRADLPIEREKAIGRAVALKRSGGREYALETGSAGRLNSAIAAVSLWEARCFGLLPERVRGNGFLLRLLKAPKWFLIRMLYP